MRAFANPATYRVPATGNLTDDVVAHVRDRPDAVAFGRKVDGAWEDVTFAQFRAEVVAVAKGLIAAGVRPGEPSVPPDSQGVVSAVKDATTTSEGSDGRPDDR